MRIHKRNQKDILGFNRFNRFNLPISKLQSNISALTIFMMATDGKQQTKSAPIFEGAAILVGIHLDKNNIKLCSAE